MACKDGSSKKRKKDKNAPKRPAGGGYGCFLAANRDEIKKSLPKDHKMTDVGKAAGEKWRAMSAAAKKPFEDEFAKKNADYKAAMEEYKKNGGGADAVRGRVREEERGLQGRDGGVQEEWRRCGRRGGGRRRRGQGRRCVSCVGLAERAE